MIFFGGCLMLIGGGFYRAANHPAYRDSVERIKNDPRVIEALGEPVSIGWGRSYHEHFGNDQHTAGFKFPVSGPEASGEAVVDAVANDGKWTIKKLDVNTGVKTISLLPKSAIEVAPEQPVEPREVPREEKKSDDMQSSDPDPDSTAVVNEAAAAVTPSDEPQ